MVMRRIVVSEKRSAYHILTVVSILGLDQVGLCTDKLHEKKLQPAREDNFPFHKTDMRGSLFFGDGHTFYLGI
jgi:hypothetical protein